ncbi:pinopsin-like isoform X2 [Bolinopsis microptera]|uniref:pinopsin-like isoform X2 n=1 Tax=Bolinopsis microptera TaxID=2820187 RepID=UPI0030796CC2
MNETGEFSLKDLPHNVIFFGTTEAPDPRDHFSSFQLIIMQVMISLVALAGALGNLLIAAVVLTFRRWRVPTNIFLCNVAVADLIICLWTLPLMIASINKGWWPLPIWLCSLGGFLDNASYVCSAWSLAFGSLERFYLVLSRGKNRETMSYSVAILFCGSIWIFSIILAALPVLGWNRYVYSPLTFSCAINGFMKGIHKYYFITFLILVLPGPLLIILFNYSYVFIFIARLPKRNAVERNNHLKVVIPLVLITIAFVLCSLPTTVILVILLFTEGHQLSALTPFHYNIIHWVLLLDSCVNPMICAFLSKKFRGACKQLLAAISKSTAETIRHTFTAEGGLVHRIRHSVADYLTRCAHSIRKDVKAMKKAVTSTMCPKIFRSESENFVIKVTINNRSGLSMDPLLSATPQDRCITQLTSIASSKDTDSVKRQSSTDSRRTSLEGFQAGAASRRTSGDRNPAGILKDVIIEEVEPILIWCTCGMNRCRCMGIPATPV